MDLPRTITLDCEFDGNWLTIWLNQPDKRNALTGDMQRELGAVLTAVRSDRSVRGITLRGRDGVFCAGGDLKAFREMASGKVSHAEIVASSKAGGELFRLASTMPQPVIVVIEGAAIAGGLGLSCCADVVICHVDAKFALTETAIGLTPAQISPYVMQKLGFPIAKRLMVTAARFDGREAWRLGLADILANTVEELSEHEHIIRKQVLGCAPGAIADTKSLILAFQEELAPQKRIALAAENFANRFFCDEGREGLASFIEKRKPEWASSDG